MNRAVFVRDSEVQGTAVREPESQFKARAMKARNVEGTSPIYPALHFKVRCYRLTIVRKVLIHGEMVMNASEAPAFVKEGPIADRLLDQTLNCHRGLQLSERGQ